MKWPAEKVLRADSPKAKIGPVSRQPGRESIAEGAVTHSAIVRILVGSACAAALACAVGSIDAAAASTSCESLASLSLPHTTITSAQSVAAGGFHLPNARGSGG